jgi:hypothetical protein
LRKVCDILFNDKSYSKPTIEKARELQLQHLPREGLLIPIVYQKKIPYFVISPEATRENVNRMDNNIHTGKDGFSIDAIKQLIRAHPTRQEIRSPSDINVEEQTTFFNRTIAQPTVSKNFSDYIAGGQMIGIGKKNGKPRAIAMSRK